MHRGCSCLRQPLSQTFGLPAPRKGEPFGVVLCAKIYELTLRLEQGRLTHCRSQFSLFLPVLRFASSATGGAQLRTSPAARRISHGAAIFHIAKAIFHPFVRTDFTARKRAYSIPSSAVSIASSVFPSFAVSAAANCAFSGWHRALRLWRTYMAMLQTTQPIGYASDTSTNPPPSFVPT